MKFLNSKLFKKVALGTVCMSFLLGSGAFANTGGYYEVSAPVGGEHILFDSLSISSAEDDDISIGILPCDESKSSSYIISIIDVTDEKNPVEVCSCENKGAYTFNENDKLQADHKYALKVANLGDSDFSADLFYDFY